MADKKKAKKTEKKRKQPKRRLPDAPARELPRPKW